MAYTVDGGELGVYEYENFNAAAALVRVHGVGIHPGSAKNIMKNAATIAMELHSLLPADQVPEKTEGYEGFIHLTDMSGDVVEAELHYIIRDHDRTLFEEKKACLRAAVEEINRRFLIQVREQYPGDEEKVRQMAVIYDGQVHMARLAIVGGYSVNGVAKLHTEILKKQTLKDFYEMTPEKFNNKTNGITQRRFLLHGNPLLADWVTEYAGNGWITDLPKIEKIAELADDTQAQKEFMEIKYKNKVRLAKYIKEHNGIDVDPNSIFDVQVKRLHEYKRQFMNILHIMYLYDRLKKNPDMPFYPRTFIFGAKASAGYERAKAIIKLINSVGDVVNNDPTIKGKIKVVFIEDYRVSNAELLMFPSRFPPQVKRLPVPVT